MLRLLCASFILQITTTTKNNQQKKSSSHVACVAIERALSVPPSPCFLPHVACSLSHARTCVIKKTQKRCMRGHRTLSPPSQHVRMRILKRKTQADYNNERAKTSLTCQCAVFFPTPIGVCILMLMLMLMLIPHAHMPHAVWCILALLLLLILYVPILRQRCAM